MSQLFQSTNPVFDIQKGSIRPYQSADETALVKILQEPNGHYHTSAHVDLEGFEEDYVFECEGRVLGSLCLEMHPRLAQLICYVSPLFRNKGIGSQLFNYGKTRLVDLDPNTIWYFFRNDVGHSANFYRHRGAQDWYSYHYMIYDPQTLGIDQDALASSQKFNSPKRLYDEVIPYETTHFDSYLNGRADAFLPINQMIDSRPYDERERRERLVKWTEKNADKLWLFYKDHKIVGSIALFDGFFDELFVIPEHQGTGLGSAIVNWALNHCRNNHLTAELCVVTGNQPAVELYLKNGFRITQTLEMSRAFNPNKEPDYSGPIGG